MIERIGKVAMLEQLAEEAAELTQAALKYARKIRGENPTPKTIDECMKALKEEFTDVMQCACELDLEPDIKQMEEKYARFEQRWDEYNKATTEDIKNELFDLIERMFGNDH